MVGTFEGIKADISQQMQKHEQHLQQTSSKFQSVDQRVDVDLQEVIKEMKYEAEDLNKRLYNVQIE